MHCYSYCLVAEICKGSYAILTAGVLVRGWPIVFKGTRDECRQWIIDHNENKI